MGADRARRNQDLPVTWVDRSVTVRMARKGRGNPVERLREDKDLGFDALASRGARWAADHLGQLRCADPDLPAMLDDRAADNWRMLVAIADLAGGDWGRRARTRRSARPRPTSTPPKPAASSCSPTSATTSTRPGRTAPRACTSSRT